MGITAKLHWCSDPWRLQRPLSQHAQLLESTLPRLYPSPRRIRPPIPDSAALHLFRARHPPIRGDISRPRVGGSPSSSPRRIRRSDFHNSASEVFLERLADRGAAISIHRPCTPIGDSAPTQDALNSLLRFSATLGATPQLARMAGYLDFQKVEILAEEIAAVVASRFSNSCTSPSPAPSGVSFFHHSSNVKVPIKSFREYMEKVHNRPFKGLGLRDWSSLALERGIEPLIPSFLEAIDDNEDTMRYPYLGR